MTSTSTLVVDDTATLIDALSSTANRIGIKSASFFTSLTDAWNAAAEGKFHRYVADQNFEGETQTGIDFLESVRAKQPDAELILLTGKYITSENRERIDSIGASLVKKNQLDTDVLTLILSPAPLPDDGLAAGPEIDIAELRLHFDDLNRQFSEVKMLNDVLVEDIISELKSIPSQKAPALMISGRLLSAADLRQELENRTEIGLELIHLHHQLNRQLRNNTKQYRKRLVAYPSSSPA